MIAEPIIYKKAGSTDYNSYPVGSIILSASGDVGEEWLRCDGTYINESTYPELTKFLGKNSPGVRDFTKMGGESYSGVFSTSYLYNGYLWVFWNDERKLIGFKTDGTETKEIPLIFVNNETTFVEPDYDNPIVLSICGGRIFIVQRLKFTDNSHAFYTGQFGVADLITLPNISMESIDLTAFLDENVGKDGKNYSTSHITDKIVDQAIPEVVFVDGFFYMYIGGGRYYSGNTSSGNSSYSYYYHYYLSIDASNVSTMNLIHTNIGNGALDIDTIENYTGWNKRFSRKTENELFIIQTKTFGTSSNDETIISKIQEIYSGDSSATVYIPTNLDIDPDITSPIAVKDDCYIQRAYIKDNKVYLRANTLRPFAPYIMKTDSNSGNVNNQVLSGIRLSPYAVVFQDSFEYIESHKLYLIFVGTGFCFSHTPLDMNSWGYLDTTTQLGVITQFGCCEYDKESNTLCLSGRNSNREYVVGMLKFHETFDYSNDGAWLPYIASDGVPAWIKAIDTSGSGELENEMKVSLQEPTTTLKNPFSYYGSITFNNEVIAPGTYYYDTDELGNTFSVGYKLRVTLTSSNISMKVFINGVEYISQNNLSQSSYMQKSVTLETPIFKKSGIKITATLS